MMKKYLLLVALIAAFTTPALAGDYYIYAIETHEGKKWCKAFSEKLMPEDLDTKKYKWIKNYEFVERVHSEQKAFDAEVNCDWSRFGIPDRR